MKKSLVNKKKKGFTLIELIIVLAVMAIIAAIAVPSYNAIKENSAKKADEQSRATVERVATMLAADGSLEDATYTVTFDTNKKAVAKNGDTTHTVFTSALSEVKPLQSKDDDKKAATGFTVKVSNQSAKVEIDHTQK